MILHPQLKCCKSLRPCPTMYYEAFMPIPTVSRVEDSSRHRWTMASCLWNVFTHQLLFTRTAWVHLSGNHSQASLNGFKWNQVPFWFAVNVKETICSNTYENRYNYDWKGRFRSPIWEGFRKSMNWNNINALKAIWCWLKFLRKQLFDDAWKGYGIVEAPP